MGIFRYMTVILQQYYKRQLSGKCMKTGFLRVFIKIVKKV